MCIFIFVRQTQEVDYYYFWYEYEEGWYVAVGVSEHFLLTAVSDTPLL